MKSRTTSFVIILTVMGLADCFVILGCCFSRLNCRPCIRFDGTGCRFKGFDIRGLLIERHRCRAPVQLSVTLFFISFLFIRHDSIGSTRILRPSIKGRHFLRSALLFSYTFSPSMSNWKPPENGAVYFGFQILKKPGDGERVAQMADLIDVRAWHRLAG